MINIDTVYQKVLALANKEQRGYITPQEFNLMADKAQKEIYDSYFHDIKTAYHKAKNEMGVAFDEIEITQEKLHPFKVSTTITQSADDATASLPSNLYLIDVVLQNTTIPSEVTELTKKEIAYTQNNPLTAATKERPVYVRESATFTNSVENAIITFYPTPAVETIYTVHYYKTPTTPTWGYVVVSGKALYNNNTSYTTHFELHESEEEILVSRILQLAGVIVMKPGLMEVGMTDKASIKQEQNN